MHRRAGKTAGRTAFTLIEMLSVIAIIALLASVLLVWINAAKRRAKITIATAEVRDLSKAWKGYRQTYGKWPSGYDGKVMSMDGAAMRILLGRNPAENPLNKKFLDVEAQAAIDYGYRDPWDQLYKVDFSRTVTPGQDFYETTVQFPNRGRNAYR
jgi:prepilin-type N-terminal cleavage/methylation domain-containing protein